MFSWNIKLYTYLVFQSTQVQIKETGDTWIGTIVHYKMCNCCTIPSAFWSRKDTIWSAVKINNWGNDVAHVCDHGVSSFGHFTRTSRLQKLSVILLQYKSKWKGMSTLGSQQSFSLNVVVESPCSILTVSEQFPNLCEKCVVMQDARIVLIKIPPS